MGLSPRPQLLIDGTADKSDFSVPSPTHDMTFSAPVAVQKRLQPGKTERGSTPPNTPTGWHPRVDAVAAASVIPCRMLVAHIPRQLRTDGSIRIGSVTMARIERGG